MCGIAGYIGGSVRERLATALNALCHRGPDDSGTTFFRVGPLEVGLGATRLAIVDLSPAGHMPMSTADGACSIVFNGEIYDMAVHRRQLKSRGVHFRSQTDTEVLLYGLALDGPAFLDRIDGMFTFGFWDTRSPAGLLVGRDRFGEKPLYLAEQSGSLFFASELPALIHLLGRTPDIDVTALRHLLEWGYPPTERSILSGVRKLPPGQWEWHGLRDGSGALASLDADERTTSCADIKTAAAMVREALVESVRDRLVADVPVGVFLSGGTDSAGIASIASSLLPKGERLNTYTVGYPSSRVSELKPARQFATWLGTRHHEIHLDDRSLSALPFVAASLSEPIGDPAALPTYFLSRFARTTSTVLLTGEGADEIFYGYPRYLLHDVAEKSPLGSLFNRTGSRIAAHTIARVRNAPSDPNARDRIWKGLPWPKFNLFVADNLPQIETARCSDSAARQSRLDDLRRWLPSGVLARVDSMTMAASIESRAPYLAREVARLGLQLPDNLLRRFPSGKVALRAALSRYLPMRKRFAAKRPFAVPMGEWILGPLRSLFEEVFFGTRLLARGWFRLEALRAIGSAVLRRDPSVYRLAWTIMTLELWARAHLDGETPERPDIEEFLARKPVLLAKKSIRKNLLITLDFPPAVGGIQMYNRELWSYGGAGDVTVLAPRADNDAAFDRTFPGQVHRLASGAGYTGRVFYLLGLALTLPFHLHKGTVIHVTHVGLAPALLPYITFRRNPVVVWTYALELTDSRHQRVIRTLLQRADRVIVISDYTRELAMAHGAPQDRIVKINPGGDDLKVQFPSADGQRFRSQQGIGPDDFVLLSVGRLSPLNRYKGFDRVIEVASLLVQRGRRIRWFVAGSGSDLGMYRARVQQFKLENYLSFLGGVDDSTLAEAYDGCDLFCLISRNETSRRGILGEGYGIVYVEAGSFGKPVLGLNQGGVPDAVLHGRTGLLIEEDNASLIANAIEKLIDDCGERHRLGNNGLQHALTEASWSTARRRTREMLNTL